MGKDSVSTGPWHVLDCRQLGEQLISVATSDGRVVCRIRNEVSKLPLDDNDLANARAIALVPDMAGALKQAVYLLRKGGHKDGSKNMRPLVELLKKIEQVSAP